MEVQVPKNNSEAVLSRLQEMLQAIDKSLLTRKQKLLLYSGGVCPRLSWPLLIQEFFTTWMERQVDSLVTGYRVPEEVVWAWKVSQYSSPLPPPLAGWPEPSLSLHPPQKASGLPAVSAPHLSGLLCAVPG
jgi:hypothetical protein